MRLLLPPLLISVDWFLKKCICVHSTADTALLFYTKWWNFAMLFRKNPKNSSEILQSVAKLVDFFYFLSDFQGMVACLILWLKKQFENTIQNKSFSVQQFFKNAAEVWASSPHLRSKLKLHNERKQKSKRESEESQLPLKLKGCNEITRFQGQLRFPRQAGDVPQPCRIVWKWFL